MKQKAKITAIVISALILVVISFSLLAKLIISILLLSNLIKTKNIQDEILSMLLNFTGITFTMFIVFNNYYTCLSNVLDVSLIPFCNEVILANALSIMFLFLILLKLYEFFNKHIFTNLIKNKVVNNDR